MTNELPPAERGPQTQGPVGPETPLHYDEQALTEMFQAPDAQDASPDPEYPHARPVQDPEGFQAHAETLDDILDKMGREDDERRRPRLPYHSRTSGRSDLPDLPGNEIPRRLRPPLQ